MDTTIACTAVALGGAILGALQCLATHGIAVGVGVALERLYPDEVLYAEVRARRHLDEAHGAAKEFVEDVYRKAFADGQSSKNRKNHVHVADDGCVFGNIEASEEEEDPKKEA